MARVQAGKSQAYEQVLTEYDAAVAAAPADPALAVERCHFIARFTDDEVDWIKRAPADLKACTRQIDTRWPRDPHVRLFDLDRLYGGDAVKLGEPWLADATAWPVDLRRQLFAKMSRAYGNDDKSGKGGDLAVQAAELGEPTRVAAAVKRLVATGQANRAQILLHNAQPATSAWLATQRVDAALQLPDRSAALTELHRYDNTDFKIGATAAAKACLRAGNVICAQDALKTAGNGYANKELNSVRFDVAIAASDMPAAASLIDFAGGKGFTTAVQRFVIVIGHAPAMLFTSRLMFIAMTFLCVLLIMALTPALVLVPVHYRGLMRRVRGKPPTALFERIGLRHAWWASAVIICTPLLVATVVAPYSLAALLGGKSLPGQGDLVRVSLWAAIAGLLLLVPVARRMGLRRLMGDRIAWRSWWRVPLAWAILIAVGMAAAQLHGHAETHAVTMQTRMIDSLVEGGRARFGIPWVLLFMAVLVPIYEELVFRGLLLGGMTRHISFGWATTIQAVLFALAHNDSPRFLFYLTLGLLSGWLARKSRSLGPSIALHGANNLLATVLRITLTAR